MKLLYLIWHRLLSISRKGYGIHSPFVYDFQKVILRPKDSQFKEYIYEKDKVSGILLRMLAHYDLMDILLLDISYYSLFDKHHVKYDKQVSEHRSYDLVVLNAKDSIDKISLSDKAFVVLKGANHDILENTAKEKCNVFLNLYNVGICVYNNGLSRQEFKLRF